MSRPRAVPPIVRKGFETPAAVGALYVSTVLGLLAFARGWSPFLPDESQYLLVAENLLRYGRFEYRGEFPLLVAPVYPTLLAGFRLLTGAPPETAIPVLNALAWGLVVVPVHALGRALGLDRPTAWLLAAAAPWVAGAWLVRQAMAEAVFYPLVLTAIAVGVRSLDGSRPGWAVLHGSLLALAVLTKPAGLALVPAWLGALLVADARDRRAIGLGLVVAAAGILPWLALRGALVGWAPGDVIVSYRPSADAVSIARVLAFDFPAHLAWVFVASGGGLALAFLLGARDLAAAGGPSRPIAAFGVTFTVVVSLGAAGFDAAQLGRFDERYLLVLAPVALLFAARGLGTRTPGRAPALALGSALLGAIVLWLLDADLVRRDPLFSAPFARGLALLGEETGRWDPGVHGRVFGLRAALVGAAFSMLWFLPGAVRARIGAGLALLVLVTVSTNVLAAAGRRAHEAERTFARDAGSLPAWLAQHVPEGARLHVSGPPAPFQPRRADPAAGSWIGDAGRAFGPSTRDLLRAEARGRYDVRMISAGGDLPATSPEGDVAYVLSAIPLEGLSPVAVGRDGRLFRGVPPREIRPARGTRFLLRELASPGTRFEAPDGFGRGGWNATAIGTVADGGLGEVAAGRHVIRVCWQARRPGTRLVVELRDEAIGAAVGVATLTRTTREPVFDFRAGPGSRLSLRASLASGAGIFCGALLERHDAEGASPLTTRSRASGRETRRARATDARARPDPRSTRIRTGG